MEYVYNILKEMEGPPVMSFWYKALQNWKDEILDNDKY